MDSRRPPFTGKGLDSPIPVRLVSDLDETCLLNPTVRIASRREGGVGVPKVPNCGGDTPQKSARKGRLPSHTPVLRDEPASWPRGGAEAPARLAFAVRDRHGWISASTLGFKGRDEIEGAGPPLSPSFHFDDLRGYSAKGHV